MFWKKVILLLLIPVLLLSLGHLHADTHGDHDDHICAHAHHEHQCDGCNNDAPEKTAPPRDTAVVQLAQLRLLAGVLLQKINTAPRAVPPRESCIRLEHRHKRAAQKRLLSVQFLT